MTQTKKSFNELVGDLTGNEIETIENQLGTKIEDAGAFGLTRALGFVVRRRTDPLVTWKAYGDRKYAEILEDAQILGDDEEQDEAGKDESA